MRGAWVFLLETGLGNAKSSPFRVPVLGSEARKSLCRIDVSWTKEELWDMEPEMARGGHCVVYLSWTHPTRVFSRRFRAFRQFGGLKQCL